MVHKGLLSVDVGKEVVGGLKVNEDEVELLRECFSCKYRNVNVTVKC